MTFAEAILNVAGAFVGPFAIIVYLGAAIFTAAYWLFSLVEERRVAGAIALGVTIVVALILWFSVWVYVAANGLGPWSWA